MNTACSRSPVHMHSRRRRSFWVFLSTREIVSVVSQRFKPLLRYSSFIMGSLESQKKIINSHVVLSSRRNALDAGNTVQNRFNTTFLLFVFALTSHVTVVVATAADNNTWLNVWVFFLLILKRALSLSWRWIERVLRPKFSFRREKLQLSALKRKRNEKKKKYFFKEQKNKNKMIINIFQHIFVVAATCVERRPCCYIITCETYFREKMVCYTTMSLAWSSLFFVSYCYD